MILIMREFKVVLYKEREEGKQNLELIHMNKAELANADINNDAASCKSHLFQSSLHKSHLRIDLVSITYFLIR